MVQIAVTGGIACGKTLVGEFLKARGVVVCDADPIAHDLLRRGEPVFEGVVEAFGPGVLTVDGDAIDRGLLGGIVFGDAVARARLNALVHPVVAMRLDAWRRDAKAAGAYVIAALVPLLFEAGMDAGWDAVVCVVASPATQRERLLARGLSEAAAVCRMQAQLPQAVKAARSDYVIVNDGTRDVAEEQTSRVLKRILERPYGRERE